MAKQKVDYIISGQGIAGILLAYELTLVGATCLVFDDEDCSASSLHAGALMNPVNLNTAKIFPGQEADFKTAINTYQALEHLLSVAVLQPLRLFVFPKASQWETFIANKKFSNLTSAEQKILTSRFNNTENILSLSDVFKINFHKLKTAWLSFLKAQQLYRSEKFEYAQCRFEDNKVYYRNFEAEKIIFCEGAKGKHNPFFTRLPFTDNQGNVLILQIQELPDNQAYHFQGKKLIPSGQGFFWYGSNYQWDANNTEPNKEWREENIRFLKSWLKIPFILQHHFIAQRPTTAGQQPLLLRHPDLPAFFFNGLGTRGFSRGPVLAKEMAQLCRKP